MSEAVAKIGSPHHFGWLHGVAGAVVVLNLLDAALTLLWVSSGVAAEANPLMDVLLAAGPLAFVAAKLALVSLGVGLLWRLRHQRAAVVALFAVFITYYAILIEHMGQVGWLLVHAT